MLGIKFIMLQAALDGDFFILGGVLLIRQGLSRARRKEIICEMIDAEEEEDEHGGGSGEEEVSGSR